MGKFYIYIPVTPIGTKLSKRLLPYSVSRCNADCNDQLVYMHLVDCSHLGIEPPEYIITLYISEDNGSIQCYVKSGHEPGLRNHIEQFLRKIHGGDNIMSDGRETWSIVEPTEITSLLEMTG